MYTETCMLANTHIYTCMHACLHTHTHTYTHIHTHTHTYTHIHTHTHTYTHIHTHTHTYTHIHTHTHTYTHIHTHTHTYTHIHTHMHTVSHMQARIVAEKLELERGAHGQTSHTCTQNHVQYTHIYVHTFNRLHTLYTGTLTHTVHTYSVWLLLCCFTTLHVITLHCCVFTDSRGVGHTLSSDVSLSWCKPRRGPREGWSYRTRHHQERLGSS